MKPLEPIELRETTLLKEMLKRARSLSQGEPGAMTGNGEHRFVRAGITGLTSGFAKTVQLVCTLALVPVTYRFLGAERFGLWMTITALLQFVTFADMGLGSGLTTAIAKSLGKSDKASARQSVSCAFWILCTLACAMSIGFFLFFPHVPWASLYRVRSELAASEAGPVTAILFAWTALNMPLGTAARVQLGYQQGFITDLWTACGNVLGLLGVLLAVHLRAGLPAVVLAFVTANLLTTCANWVVEFGFRRRELFPRMSFVSVQESSSILRIGFLFFIQQICGLVYYVSDNIVIVRLLGPVEVARFAMVQKLFSAGLLASLFLNPLWPAFGEALSRGDFAWARRAVRRVQIASLAAGSICGGILLAVSGPVLAHWMDPGAGALRATAIASAFWVILVSYVAGMNSVLNQPGMMVKHLFLFGGSAFVALLLKIYLAPRFGIAGVVWATVITFGVLYVFPTARLASRSYGPNRACRDQAAFALHAEVSKIS